jgi:hypothetical protein
MNGVLEQIEYMTTHSALMYGHVLLVMFRLVSACFSLFSLTEHYWISRNQPAFPPAEPALYAVGEKNHQFKYYVLALLKVAMFLFSFAGNTLTTLSDRIQSNASERMIRICCHRGYWGEQLSTCVVFSLTEVSIHFEITCWRPRNLDGGMESKYCF